MANTIDDLRPTLYSALDTIGRELIGFIPLVSRDASAEQGAVGQTVRSPVVPQNSLEDITPGANPADSGDQDFDYVDVQITKSKAYPIRWSGEEQLALTPFGMVNVILQKQFTQAFRTLANAVEADLAGLYTKVSRAYGSPGTTPFATADDMTDFAEANRILDENGASAIGRRMVLGHAARAKLEGKHSHLFKVDEAGTADLLRQRELRQVGGFAMGYSGGIGSHVKGTGTLYDVDNGSGEAVGQTTITLDGGTAGATGIKAGDVVTFATDTANKYVVNTGLGTAAGDIVIGAPGLRNAVADATELTIGNSYTPNMFFTEDALLLAARTPAMPMGGDASNGQIEIITDPVSGLSFQLAIYPEYRRVKYEIGLAWGVAAPNPAHAGILMG